MSETIRSVRQTFRGTETLEGAGVRLRRMFGNSEVPLLDPFLLLDNFGSSNPADYLAGFPWHPHRGIETVTYMLHGKTAHEDSLGNKGVIDSGDVQWMSAGSGILHQEMPKRTEGVLSGFQLWVNLPRDHKLETPSYRGVESRDIPLVHGEDGREVRVIAGEYQGVVGPVQHIPVDPVYLDVTLPVDSEFHLPVKRGHTAFAQAIEGTARFDGLGVVGEGSGPTAPGSDRPAGAQPAPTGPGHTLLYGDGDAVRIRAGSGGVRFLLGAGRPLHEPVAWYGPIVMNTREEIAQALADLRQGTFVRGSQIVNEV
ncbi:MAG: pirin family protein [Thermoplasmata archaeon]|nr:pirin family protein [Thermoplasmata archaeon]MCI4359298.1 pirin family protein [Thermoplasmata archaeon]